jgi:hypothetical protein
MKLHAMKIAKTITPALPNMLISLEESAKYSSLMASAMIKASGTDKRIVVLKRLVLTSCVFFKRDGNSHHVRLVANTNSPNKTAKTRKTKHRI